MQTAETKSEMSNVDLLVWDLILLNGQFNSNIGFRSHDVYCLDREGSRVEFAPPQEIRRILYRVLTHWQEKFSAASNPREIASSLAFFWYSFIAIHPFADANGRTAKIFIKQKLELKSLKIVSFEFVDRFLLRGDVGCELKELETIFLLSLANK